MLRLCNPNTKDTYLLSELLHELGFKITSVTVDYGGFKNNTTGELFYIAIARMLDASGRMYFMRIRPSKYEDSDKRDLSPIFPYDDAEVRFIGDSLVWDNIILSNGHSTFEKYCAYGDDMDYTNVPETTRIIPLEDLSKNRYVPVIQFE